MASSVVLPFLPPSRCVCVCLSLPLSLLSAVVSSTLSHLFLFCLFLCLIGDASRIARGQAADLLSLPPLAFLSFPSCCLSLVLFLSMEGVIKSLIDAHNEVMEQTGWGRLLANLTAAVQLLPEASQSILEEVSFFRHSVHWGDPFFKCLLAFHVGVATLVVYLVFVRWQPKRPRPEGVTRAMELAAGHVEEKLFALSVVLVLFSLSAYPLNALGTRHGHRLFADAETNYFDGNVIFIGVVYWLPLVLLSLLVQLKLMFNVLRLLVVSKGEQLKARRRAAERATAAAAAAATAEAEKGTEEKKHE